MKKLIKLFKELPFPNSEKEDFSATEINSKSKHRIGKDVNGNPTLLINIKNINDEVLSDIKLRNISVMFDIKCRLANEKEDKLFTLITFSGADSSLSDSFLRVAQLFLEHLDNEPSQNEITKIVNKLVKLFRDISSPPLKSVQGLWAELFFISIQENPKNFILAWHPNIEDNYDFNFGKTRIEIKSSSNRKRHHFFSLKQLEEINNTRVIITSIFAEQSPNGKSMEDLIEIIKQKINNDLQLLEKIYYICYKTLNNSLDNSFKIKYDAHLGKDSIRHYDLKKIPKLRRTELAKGILDLKLLINLEDVNTLKDEEL